ncbi:MAG: winged helix DNA-binding protein [Porticoccaceae bacterium]
MPSTLVNKLGSVGLDKHWHLSATEHEISLTEIEFALFRTFSAFSRWMDDLALCSVDGDSNCNGIDFAVLNVIRMHDRPKALSDIARLLNRDDLSNMQYTLRKLIKAGLVEKVGSEGQKKGVTYRVTDLGEIATERYAQFRRELLIPMTQALAKSEDRMEQVAKVLRLLSGIYDQAACVVASHRE